MQKTHLRPAKYDDIKKQWHREVYYISLDTTFWDGILLLTNGFSPEIDILKMSTKGRFVISRASNISNVVVALYTPSGILREKQRLRQNFFWKLRKRIGLQTTRKDNIILIWDFNNILSAINRSTNVLGETEAKSKLENLLQQLITDDSKILIKKCICTITAGKIPMPALKEHIQIQN